MRFDELRALQKGWYEGDERVPVPGEAAIMLAERIVAELPELGVYPLLGGGVSLETNAYEIEIFNDLHVSVFGDTIEDEVELDSPSPEEVVVALRKYL